MAYPIEYSPDAVDHLQSLAARDQRILVDTIEQQLADEPLVETRNRKQ